MNESSTPAALPRMPRSGQKIRCIDAKFPACAQEWTDRLPQEGEICEVDGASLAPESLRGPPSFVLVLRGFPGVAFRQERFVPVPEQSRVSGSGGRAAAGALPQYPCIVVRIMAVVYQTEPVTVEEGPVFVKVGYGTSIVRHPSPYSAEGCLSQECRRLLVEEVKRAVERTRFPMCIKWSELECSYVEHGGTVIESNDPPSGGIQFFRGPIL